MSVYVITGCGRGIGLALTKRLLNRGEHVIGSVRKGKPPVEHANFSAVAFDVRDQAAIDRAAAGIAGPVDVLVNNAGIAGPRGSGALEVDVGAFADVLDVNVLGVVRVTQAFLPLLRRSRDAKVMTVSSQLGSMAYPGSDTIAYRTSKAAVNKLMQGMSADLASAGIAAIVAHPGWVRTDMGGRSAPISVEESAAGLLRLLDGLGTGNSGRFMDWDGSERPW
jgi:NAD(P)-dependent dehydrogenase (short-subunit alcohol dehydrogenase family)